ncbi:DNA mismatch repair protein MutS [Planifilum fulgidum]|uniref:DNA mismatch repair protein MutS n=1 Tax=Planifilum fulgidum TaxID=201973 RepID=A0A1I2PDW8_9BACL|nr:DNA mismatch repair protein MutS [Planifilum fulgidum]MBO2496154.1 DNA mismatch repair protein MutS [Bacillota bacterium]MBO2532981.1 DNA mismatch repair protein MutS [Thermoactinomycetaceae bacterium]SFG14335.1 DNA mismatch repair protein MutS [Planifilum fulgidum]
MANYTPMIQQYLSIKAEYPDAFLFFRLGDFYEMFFEDAKKAAEELEIVLTSRDGGKERVPMCGVPYHSAETYIERLINKGYKVAICEQVEDPSQAKGVVRREVVRVITPGTVIEEQMLEEKENNFLVVLAGDGHRSALAACDLSTGECHITQLEGAEDLLDEAATYHPREVLISGALARDKAFVKQSSTRLGSVVTPVDEEELPPLAEMERQLREQFPEDWSLLTSPELTWAAGVLLSYLRRTQKRTLRHLHRLHRYDVRRYMMLDDSARRNLELTTTIRGGKRQGSLLWLLDRTATAMGSRMLKRWLDKPLLDLKEILARQDAVEAFAGDPILLEEVRTRLKGIYDLERISARIAYGSANGRDLRSLCRSLQAVPSLKEKLVQSGKPVLVSLAERMDPCADVARLVEEAIVEDPPATVKEGGVIRDGYDSGLDELRRIQREGKDWIARLEEREREITGIKSLKVGYNKVFGYYIEVTKANLRHLPEGRYQRKQTLANAERFITPELKERERQVLEAEERSIALEYRLFAEVREAIAEQIPRLQALAEEVARLDVLQSFAAVSLEREYVRPSVEEGGELLIEEGRHPVVEAVMESGRYVPNDVRMDGDRRQILLITGPNMAGKSTYMRQTALIVIMAQIGCFVPAKRAVIPVVDRIFTRIGAADDLTGGRSTFMVEMAETRQALMQATPSSLILLDEVGRGTSTYDGMALAQAIVEYVHNHVRAKTLFSTHYHELTGLEESLSRLVNVHARCIEKEGKVVFLHRIEPGRADRSYGIHVAERAGLPEAVISRARVILEELESRSETAATGQLNLFQFMAEPEREKGEMSAKEKQVIEDLLSWDVLRTPPLDTVQFLYELQRRLRDDEKSGGR